MRCHKWLHNTKNITKAETYTDQEGEITYEKIEEKQRLIRTKR